MKERNPKKTYTVVTYTIYPIDKWMLLSDLLEELTKLELRQAFLASEINRQLEQEPERVPPVAKSLEMDINEIRIQDLNKMIERLNQKRKRK